MKKKWIAMLLVVALVLPVLAACGGEAPTENGGAPTQETGTQTGTVDKKAPLAGTAKGGNKAGDVIKIGVFEPLTGANAAGGKMTLDGIEMAHAEVGEVLGKKVELVTLDNKGEKVESTNAVQRLVDSEKVVAIIGSYGSSSSMAAGPVVKEAEVPAVGCSPTNPLVTLNNEYYFRVCFIDPFQGAVMANYAVNDLKAKTAAIILDVQSDYSVGLTNYFKKAFIEATGDEKSIVAEANFNTGDKDFNAQLTNVQSASPDVIFAPSASGDGALMIKQARDKGITAPFLGGDTWEAPEFISIGGSAVEGAAYSSHFSAEKPLNDVSQKFLEAYKAKFNREADGFAALGYDAYMFVIDAIKRANSADSVAIRDAIAVTKDYIGATGTISLDENGDANKSAVINQVKDGAFVYLTTVEPAAEDTGTAAQ